VGDCIGGGTLFGRVGAFRVCRADDERDGIFAGGWGSGVWLNVGVEAFFALIRGMARLMRGAGVFGINERFSEN